MLVCFLEWARLLHRIRYVRQTPSPIGEWSSFRNTKIMRAECFGSIRRHRFLSRSRRPRFLFDGGFSRGYANNDGGGGKNYAKVLNDRRGGRATCALGRTRVTRERVRVCECVRARARSCRTGPPYVEWVTSNGRGCGIFRSVCK